MKRYVSVLALGILGTVLGLVPTTSTTSTAEAVDDAGVHVVLAVGDLACDQSDPKFNGGNGTSTNCAQKRVSDQMLADRSGFEAVLGLGDYQYHCGDPADYAASYNLTFSRLDALMHPVVGNHEYNTGTDPYGQPCPTGNSTAKSYFDHFGPAAHPESAGHYSFNIGSWHFIALNGNCSKQGVGGCRASSPQTTWLKNDLATVDSAAQPCIAAFWHQPLWNGGRNALIYQTWWNVLYNARADVVLNGHKHNYQRYAALNPSGAPDPVNGITEYIVGGGGQSLAGISSTASPKPAAFARTFGYLRMTLGSAGWTAEFVNSSGSVLDSSTGTCHI